MAVLLVQSQQTTSLTRNRIMLNPPAKGKEVGGVKEGRVAMGVTRGLSKTVVKAAATGAR